MSSTLTGYLTTKEVAAKFKVSQKSVLRIIRLGRLKAEKPGGSWQWLVHERDLPQSWPPPVNHDA